MTNPTDDCLPAPIFVEYTFPDPDDRDSLEESHDIDLDELLEKAALKFMGVEDGSQSKDVPSLSTVVSCSPMSQGDQDQMTELSKQFENLSDSILLRDTYDQLALPSLSGAMRSFEKEGIDGISSACGWGEHGSWKGASDTFMTVPTARRDRLLMSNECYFSGGSSTFHSDAVNASTTDDDTYDDSMPYDFRPSDEETYLPLPTHAHSFILPSRMPEARKYDNIRSRSADVGSILEWEKEKVLRTATHVVGPILSETRL